MTHEHKLKECFTVTQVFVTQRIHGFLAYGVSMIKILDVRIGDFSISDCLQDLQILLSNDTRPPASVFFVNAHTLNVASRDQQYRQILSGATRVFGEGTGVRWAARLHRVRLQANLNGTDLVP